MLLIQSKELLKSLKKVKPVCGANVVLPVLDYVKITPEEVACTNLRVSIKERINFEGTGEMLLPLAELIRIATACSNELLSLQPGKVTGDFDKFSLGDPEDLKSFPTIDDLVDGVMFDVSEDFVYGLVSAAKVVWPEVAHPLGNINVVYNGDDLRIYSTDRMALYKNVFKAQGDDKTPFSILVPTEFIKCLEGLTGDFKMVVGSNKLSIANETTTIVGELAEGVYAAVESVLVPREEETALFNRAEFAAALSKITSIYSCEPQCQLIFTDPQKVMFRITNPDYKQEALTTWRVEHGLKLPSFTINSQSLINLLGLLPTECITVQVGVAGHEKAVLITSAGSDVTLMMGTLINKPL